MVVHGFYCPATVVNAGFEIIVLQCHSIIFSSNQSNIPQKKPWRLMWIVCPLVTSATQFQTQARSVTLFYIDFVI